MPSFSPPGAALILLFAVHLGVGEDRYPTFVDAKTAGPDFVVQGEYVGLAGGVMPIGAQVIALSNGKFEGIMFRGGLPGAGWDRSHRTYFVGEQNGDVTNLKGVAGYKLEEKEAYWQASITNGVLRGSDQSFRNELNDVSFELRKVQRKSPTLGARPPEGAVVLFDGSGTEAWKDGRIVEERYLAHGAKTIQSFKDHRLHLEFRTPFMPTARGMHRGNSGVFVNNKFEVQIVDSFGWTFINRRFERNSWVGRSGGIEELFPPSINMSFPPLSWQTYDIDYFMARYDTDGRQTFPPMMTVRHNGVLIHNRQVLPPESEVRPDRDPGRLYLQDHGDRVVFRNIWIVAARPDSK